MLRGSAVCARLRLKIFGHLLDPFKPCFDGDCVSSKFHIRLRVGTTRLACEVVQLFQLGQHLIDDGQGSILIYHDFS